MIPFKAADCQGQCSELEFLSFRICLQPLHYQEYFTVKKPQLRPVLLFPSPIGICTLSGQALMDKVSKTRKKGRMQKSWKMSKITMGWNMKSVHPQSLRFPWRIRYTEGGTKEKNEVKHIHLSFKICIYTGKCSTEEHPWLDHWYISRVPGFEILWSRVWSQSLA